MRQESHLNPDYIASHNSVYICIETFQDYIVLNYEQWWYLTVAMCPPSSRHEYSAWGACGSALWDESVRHVACHQRGCPGVWQWSQGQPRRGSRDGGDA